MMSIRVKIKCAPAREILRESDSPLIIEEFAPEGEFEIAFSIPLIDIQGWWQPELRRIGGRLPWRLRVGATGIYNFPFLCFFNSGGCNRAAVALDIVDDDIEIVANLNQGCAAYDIVLRGNTAARLKLRIDRRDLPWQRVLADYRDAQRETAVEYPVKAWEPGFCTWYFAHTDVNAGVVERNAAIAAELGFGTLILDDGWSFDTVKRHTPEEISTWYAEVGDWEPSRRKFPDFAGHIQRVRAMGLSYLVWAAPLLIGARSRMLKRLSGAVDEKSVDGFFPLAPENEAAAELVADQVVGIMRSYPVDGLKLDYLDFLKADIQRPRGRASRQLAAKISAELRKLKPDALIEYRQHYDTPGTLALATQFRATDAPLDFMANFELICQAHLSVGDGVPVHSDPVYFHPGECDGNVARHLVAAIAGVPMLSQDLTVLTDGQRRIIRNYLAFYRQNSHLWRTGRWSSVFESGRFVMLELSGDAERIVWAASPGAWELRRREPVTGRLTVLNLTDANLPFFGRVFDGCGEERACGAIPPGGRGVAVPNTGKTRRVPSTEEFDAIMIGRTEAPDEMCFIHNQLYAYNLEKTGFPRQNIEFSVEELAKWRCLLLRTRAGGILGGLVWERRGDELHVNFLWVDSRLRGRGFGVKLLRRLIALGRGSRSARWLRLSTCTFQAPDFYRGLGFSEISSNAEPTPRNPDNRRYRFEMPLFAQGADGTTLNQ